MVISEVVTLFIYVISIAFLPEYFGACLCFTLMTMSELWSPACPPDLEFVVSTRFTWKVVVIVGLRAFLNRPTSPQSHVKVAVKVLAMSLFVLTFGV
jgi:hypothetical protein